jgi:hypothetical protein
MGQIGLEKPVFCPREMFEKLCRSLGACGNHAHHVSRTAEEGVFYGGCHARL